MRIIVATVSFLFCFAFAVTATPVIFTVSPVNNSYIFGYDTDVFSAKIIDSDLNVSTAYFHIKVEGPSVWSNIPMSANCYNSSLSDWSCNGTVPGLGALGKDGSFFFYYFDAYSINGDYGNNGTADVNFTNRVRIDRSAPRTDFENPINQSYVSGKNVTIKLFVADDYSGIDPFTINYSFDSFTWLPTFTYANDTFISSMWDTTSYSNNQSVTIYTKAADNLGNKNYTYINVSIDNEIPRLYISFPSSNQTLFSNVPLFFSAEDTYSGLDNATATFAFDGSARSLKCTGSIYSYNCSTNFDTNLINDNTYNLTYSIKDKAGNLAQNSTPVIIDNLPPVILVSSPANNAVVSGAVVVNASITDAGTGVSNASFRWENSNSSGDWVLLNCSGGSRSLSCSATWNSAEFLNNIYTIKLQAYDGLSKRSVSGVTITVNNSAEQTTTTETTTTAPVISPTTTISAENSSPTQWLLKNWLFILVVIIIVIVASFLIYLFRPKKVPPAYPGYQPE